MGTRKRLSNQAEKARRGAAHLASPLLTKLFPWSLLAHTCCLLCSCAVSEGQLKDSFSAVAKEEVDEGRQQVGRSGQADEAF